MKKMKPVEVFYSYAHDDEPLRNELDKHLSCLKRDELIMGWHDRRIAPGQEWEGQIHDHLNSADLILLLVSKNFVASNYCHDVELQRAIERHRAGEARVIPIILKPVDWAGTPFSMLQALPTDGKPVTTWRNRDEAFVDVARGIRGAVVELQHDMLSDICDDVDSPTPMGGSLGKGSIAVATDTVDVEITLNRDFNDFNDREQNRLVEAIRKLLEGGTTLKVIRKRRGSVRLTVRLRSEDAEQLVAAVKRGALQDFDVVDAKVVEQIVAENERVADLVSPEHFGLPGDRRKPEAPSFYRTIGRFTLTKTIWEDSTSALYQARDEVLDRTVALRMRPRLGIEISHDVMNEAKVMSQLQHPGIVRIYDIVDTSGEIAIIEEYIDGTRLEEKLRSGPLTPQEAAEIGIKLADPIQYMHDRGIIHRNLKPSNCLIDRRGALFLTDFALAISLWQGDQQPVGTPGYMSPEQWSGKAVDPRSDIYSLGVILYQMLTGLRPFQFSSIQEYAVFREPPLLRAINSNVPKIMEEITLKCLMKEPAKRYGTAHELADDLQDFLSRSRSNLIQKIVTHLLPSVLHRSDRRRWS